MDENVVSRRLDEINLSNLKDESFLQAFANPLQYEELDLQTHAIPDPLFCKLPVWNEMNSLTALNNNQLEFEIRRPHPILLNTLYFTIELDVTFKEDPVNTVLPIADFFGQLFHCVQINIGQNSCNIDHLDTHQDIFHYVYRRLFMDVEYSNFLGRLEGLPFDTATAYQSFANTIDPSNSLGKNRKSALLEKKTGNTYCVRGIYVPANLFFQKRKVLPPYVPLRLILRKNDKNVFFKQFQATPVDITIDWKVAKLNFMNYELRCGAYDKFREQFMKNQTRFPPLEMPINPYTNPSAIYDFLDVRATRHAIPTNSSTFFHTLSMNSSMPKAILFCLAPYLKDDVTKNHLEFIGLNLSSYSILINSQPIKSCSIDIKDCGNAMSEPYLRYRNFLGGLLSDSTQGISYVDYAGGAAIFTELTNNANSLYIPARSDVANIELKLNFKTATTNQLNLYVFLLYDQKLLIDQEFNARLITTV